MWVFLGMETIANIKYRSHVDSDSCLLAVCRWLIPHEVAPQQSFTMLQPANAKVIIKNGTTKNNHIYFILQFDPLKHSINNSSCNLTYTPSFYLSDKALEYFCRVNNDKSHGHNFTPKDGEDVAFTVRCASGQRVDDNFLKYEE